MRVILHNLRSLHNVGSIFRTADAAGVEKIYLTGITPAPVDRFGKIRPQFEKVSLGAEKSVPWEEVKSVAALLRKLKREGYMLVAIEQSRRAMPYYRFKPQKREKLAVIAGNEVRGLPPSILKKCDTILEIPMLGGKESLNVAVAFGIVVFHLTYARYG